MGKASRQFAKFITGATPLLGSQPALGLGVLGIVGSTAAFLPGKLSQGGAQPSFVRAAGSFIIQQPVYVGGEVFPLSGSVPSFAYGLGVLTAQQAAHGMVITAPLASLPVYAGGEAQAFLAAQPTYGVVRASLIGTQPLHGSVHSQMISAQPLFAPVGAIWATQGMMVRSFPALTVTPNVVAQQYKPVQAVEITV